MHRTCSTAFAFAATLDPVWSAWFDDFTVTQQDDGTTELVGPLPDQSALYGILSRLRDLGATLLMGRAVYDRHLMEQPMLGRCGSGTDSPAST